jgi:predicted lipoprotein with Yx(FWY)xxD motif
MKKSIFILILLALVVGGGAYYYQNYLKAGRSFKFVTGPVVSSAQSPSFEGEYLADRNGMTLYVFADDTDLKSTCTGACLERWPIFEYNNEDPSQFDDRLSKRINLILRPDGLVQYAYGTKPLYLYIGDTHPGLMLGQGLNDGKWSAVPVEF